MNYKAPTFRKCAVSGDLLPKEQLFRVVLTKTGDIVIENDKHIDGRGAYIKKDLKTIQLGKKKNSLSRSLRRKVDESTYDSLISLLERN